MVAHLTCNEVVVSSTLTGSSTNIVRKCYFIYLLYYVPLAQSVEPLTVNQMVVGSSPTRHAINLHKYKYFVLREKLLKQLDNGAYEPRNVNRAKVKDVLLTFRRNLQEFARSECIEGGVTTF